VTWARYSDRQKFEPRGLFGGLSGSKGKLVVNPGTPQERHCKSKGVDQLNAGDVLSIQLPGSGGYGPPTKRDPERVQWDVINGKTSVESARRNYKVVLDQDLNVDINQTTALRARHNEENEGR
jgi:N-methylhydantoinase B